MHKTTGSCHCGAVTFEVDDVPTKVIECNCTHCSRKGFLLWFVPRVQFTLTGGADQLTEYTFNRHVIKHQFCKTCGCQPFAYGLGKDGAETAAINVRCCPDVDVDAIERKQVDGKSF